MNVLDFPFPELSVADKVFPIMGAPPELIEEAKKRGFYNNFNHPACKFFSEWFFNGLKKKPSLKKNVDQIKAQRAMDWVVCFMKSWEPRHEDKHAVCALIFDAALELEK